MKIESIYNILQEETSKEDLLSMFKDSIDTEFEKGNIKRVEDLQRRLKSKFNTEYEPNSQYKKTSLDLNTLYTSQDFPTLKEYKKYCFEMFGLRFKKYKHLLVPTDTYVSVEDMRKILKGKGFTVETMDDDSSSTTAHVVGEKMIVNLANKLNKGGKVSTQTFVHEMAHIFENKFKLDQKTKHCHEMANSSSNYILNPAETFSEHFANYFLQPKYLKVGWKEVYEELTKIIPKEWRDLISSIIRASK